MSIKVDVGAVPSDFKTWETAEIRFHGFASLSTAKDDFEASPEFACLGHQWEIRLCPGGDEHSDDGMVAVNLCNCSNEGIKIDWAYSVRNFDGKEVVYHGPFSDRFRPAGTNPDACAISNFQERSTIIDALVKGALMIEVRMRLYDPIHNPCPQFIPKNPLSENILKLFMEEDSADVVFQVGGQPAKNGACKKAKASLVDFHAHRLILKDCAPALAEMCGSDSGATMTAVPISGVKPDIFKHLLYYVYGGEVAEEDLKSDAKEIIDAADKFEIVNLKLEAEALYVNSTVLTVDNMMENLLYADTKNCALLKEAVIDFVVENGRDVLEKVSLKDVPGGMFADLLTAMTRVQNMGANDESDDDRFSIMRVSELRERLAENKMNIDGSREAMIAALRDKNLD